MTAVGQQALFSWQFREGYLGRRQQFSLTKACDILLNGKWRELT